MTDKLALDTSIGEVSLTHWAPGRELSFDEWTGLGYTLQAMYKAMPWWVGDWLLYGERHWDDIYTQALEVTGQGLSALQNYRWVARQVSPATRVEGLPWSAHRAVAHLPESEQREWLAQADGLGWDVRTLTAAVKESAPENGKVYQNATTAVTVTNATSDSYVWVEDRTEEWLAQNVDLRERLKKAEAALRQGLELMTVSQGTRWTAAREYIETYDMDIL